MKKSKGGRRRDRVLRTRDLMTEEPITVHETMTVGQLCDLLQERNINGVPVVDRRGLLVGVVRGVTVLFYPPAAEASMYILMIVVLLVRPRGLMGERFEKFE